MNNLDVMTALFLSCAAIASVGAVFCLIDLAVRVVVTAWLNHRRDRSAMRDWGPERRRYSHGRRWL